MTRFLTISTVAVTLVAIVLVGIILWRARSVDQAAPAGIPATVPPLQPLSNEQKAKLMQMLQFASTSRPAISDKQADQQLQQLQGLQPAPLGIEEQKRLLNNLQNLR